MKNHRIKAIFFDLDGTLRHSVPEGAQVFDEYLISLGYPINEEDRLRAMRWEYLYWANSPDLRDDLLAHSADTENFWIEYTRRRLVAVGLSPESAKELAPQVSAHMGEMYKPESIVPHDARRLLPALKEAGYLLAVVSNRDQPFHELLASHNLSEFFHFSLAGGEVDSYKPEPGIFQHALERANVAAQETVYVGDNYFADIVGARRAGLHPVLYDPNGIFPEADCATIKSFDELEGIIESI
ncbi:MAG: HAD family hydrolase [Chloroflexota bacterium]|jgi:putative hydrolase of the HAD superfamily